VGARLSSPVQTGPGAHPASCTMRTESFLGVKSGRDVTLTTHPFLVPWSRKSRATPLLPLWAAQPVQSLSVCTRVHFTFTLLFNILGVLTCGTDGQTETAKTRGTLRNLSLPMRQNFEVLQYSHQGTQTQ